MLSPAQLAPYFGFIESEVVGLCEHERMDAGEMKRWYDGYELGQIDAVYNPYAVMRALKRRSFENYWTCTNTFESLKKYISMNFDGLKDAVICLLNDVPIKINPLRFSNDMHKVGSKDDVLTLLCHLGYLSYNTQTKSACIPNYEVRQEFESAIADTGWDEVSKALFQSEQLLERVLSCDAEAVAECVEIVHEQNTSILNYNDENALACVLSLAFYTSRKRFSMIREFPAGKGFADIILLPDPGVDEPAVVLELKYDNSAESAIAQIKSRGYVNSLNQYRGDAILVGINYNKKSKKHECKIEKYSINQGLNAGKTTENVIVDFCSEPKSLAEIAIFVGMKDKYYLKRTYIDPVLGIRLRMTNSDSPNSPTQKYLAINGDVQGTSIL